LEKRGPAFGRGDHGAKIGEKLELFLRRNKTKHFENYRKAAMGLVV
jgi:hypothetical protein